MLYHHLQTKLVQPKYQNLKDLQCELCFQVVWWILPGCVHILTLSTLPTPTALGPEYVFMGWRSRRRDAAMTVAKTTDLDPKVTPPRNPLELTCPGNWTSVIVSEEFPSIVHKCRFWKTGPTHGRLHQKKIAQEPAASKDELQLRWCYQKGYLLPEGLTW